MKGSLFEKDASPEKPQQEEAKEGSGSDNDTLTSVSRYAVFM